ncbi:MAG: putative metal-binding motif-containing protein [Candidatus Falkowbacteria bacterium]
MRKILSILNRKDLLKVLLVGVGILAGGGFFYAVKADQIQYTYYSDADGDGYGVTSTTTSATEPPAGYARNGGDCADTVAAINPGAAEVCDNIDNDCDGYVDENVLITYYRDFDGDGYGLTSSTTQACSVPSGYAGSQTDCDDGNANIKPGAAEVCDNIDNDCDGSTDESCDLITYYRDADNDTYGNPGQATTSRDGAPSGYVSNNNDCNDTKANIHPNAAEVCDNIDNDCDGSVDENLLNTYYRDLDGDTYGNPGSSTRACFVPSGYAANQTDCDDNNASVKPGAAEVCGDQKDNDCDGSTDESCDLKTYYRDADRDSFGNPSVSTTSYQAPYGYADNNRDCDDSKKSVRPGAAEICDGIDNNCDGRVDENLVSRAYYFDNDADGFGGTATTSACRAPKGYVTNNKDCNDSNRLIHPGAVEAKDSVDNDCDGKTDEDEAANASEICPYLGDNRLGTFVSCVNHYLNKLKAEGELDNPEKARILKGLIQKIKEVIKTDKVLDKAEKKEIKKEIKDKKEEISGIREGIKNLKEKLSGSFKEKGSCKE